MLNNTPKIVFLMLIALSAFATPKPRETITFRVVSSETKIQRSFSVHVFSYTNVIFTQVNGKRVVYGCVQRGHICPLMESGKIYTADRKGDFVYVWMRSPEVKNPFSVKYKQFGSW